MISYKFDENEAEIAIIHDTDFLNKYFKVEELTLNEKRVLSFYMQIGCPSKIKQVDFANALSISKNSISKIFRRLKNERRKK